jgi:nitrile hydratase accessory protein
MSEQSELPKLPKLPWDEDEGPLFKAPWEATAFAMTVRLFEQGHFTWPEWTDQLSAEIGGARKRSEPDLGDRYYEHWLNALEKIVVAKGLGTAEQLGRLTQAWTEATIATPHGQPIELKDRLPVD